MITLFHIIGLMIFKYAINYKYDSWLGLAKNYWVPYKKMFINYIIYDSLTNAMRPGWLDIL